MKTTIQKMNELQTASQRLSPSTEQEQSRKYTTMYQDISNVNFTAIVAETLSKLAFNDSDISIVGTQDRAKKIREAVTQFMENITEWQSYTLGTGGMGLIFRLDNGIPCIDMIEQDRIIINKKIMNEYKDVIIEVDSVTINNSKFTLKSRYYLKLDNGISNHIIENKVFDEQGKEVPLEIFEKAKNTTITPKIEIKNVDKLLFYHWKCPKSTRKLNSLYGVPCTYGAEKILQEAQQHHKRINDEYELAKTMLGLDERMFKDDNGTIQSDNTPFVLVPNAANEKMWEIYNPNIRASEQMLGKDYFYDLIERIVGTSGDILGKPQNQASTAYEVKANRYNTSTFIDAMWDIFEGLMQRMCYSFDVLLENAEINTGSRNQYKIEYSWNYALSQDEQQQYIQLDQQADKGRINPARVVAWVTGLSIEDAEKELKEQEEKKQAENKNRVDKAMAQLEEENSTE